MKKLFENWKKYINESEVADAAGDLEDALRKQAEEEAKKEEEQKEKDKEQDKMLKNASRESTESEISANSN